MGVQEIFDKYIGREVEVEDPSNKDQCFDWAFQYCDEIGIDRAAIRHLNAYEIFTKPNDLTLKYFDYIPNTANGAPQLGDIVIFGTGVGPSGHVAVVRSADTTSIRSTDQNWLGHKFVEYVSHPYDNVLGWLHPKTGNPQGPDAPTPLPQLTDQTSIPAVLLGTDQDQEIQWVRGQLTDKRQMEREIINQGDQIERLEADVDEARKALATCLVNPQTPPKTDCKLSVTQYAKLPSWVRFLVDSFGR